MRKLFYRMAGMLTACLLLIAPALGEDTEIFQGEMDIPTPAPTAEPTPIPEKVQPPELIQSVLEIAHNEWATLAGKRLSQSNKYTWWRCGKGCSFGWCGGFVTWCMLEAGVEMDELQNVPETAGPIYHVKEASVGKLLKGYQQLERTTQIPQPGYLVIYAVRKSANKTIHVGLVYDVEDRGNGIYRLTTLEGNVSNRVKMYIYDYDSNEDKATENMIKLSEEEQTLEANVYTSYKLHAENWYINTFLMSWMPQG